MAIVSQNLRSCPTRIDGQPVLFAHKVALSQCRDRQRGRYHKCVTCVHNQADERRNGHSVLTPSKAAAVPNPARPRAAVTVS